MSTPDGIYLGQLIVHMSLHWSRGKASLSAESQNVPQKTSPRPSMVQRAMEEEEAAAAAKENEAEVNMEVEEKRSPGVDPPNTQIIKLTRLRSMGTRDQLTDPGESKEKRLVLPRDVLRSRECKNVVSELLERSKHLQRVMAESLSTQQPAVR